MADLDPLCHSFPALDSILAKRRSRWWITGVAGFIGSHLLEYLLANGQEVLGVDNFVTGKRDTLEDVRHAVGEDNWANFRFVEADINDSAKYSAELQGSEALLHQAALGSVPRSVAEPLKSNRANVDGFLAVLEVARSKSIKRIVYASSSSVYGDEASLPKIENRIGKPQSPYAASKRCNEVYAEAYAAAYGLSMVGLRYFNVYGPRQDPNGPYAAVIPRWVASMLAEKPCVIYGDGETSRDFCFVRNVVQANVRAALSADLEPGSLIANIAVGQRTTLLELHELLQNELKLLRPELSLHRARFEPFRAGDVRHSHADISRAERSLGYCAPVSLEKGLRLSLPWYVETQS